MNKSAALVSIGTAAIAASSALFGVWLQARLSKAARQAETVHAEHRQSREWSKDTYVRLLEAIDRAERGMGRGKAYDEDSLVHAEPSLWKEEGGRLIAEVIALGSVELKELVQTFQTEHVDFFVRLEQANQMMKSGDRPADEIRELNSKRREIFRLARQIEQQVHGELRGSG